MSQGDGAYVRDGVCVYAVWKDTKCVSVMSNQSLVILKAKAVEKELYEQDHARALRVEE